MNFEPYPFEKLKNLLKDIKPNEREIIDLTIGEPQFETPEFIQDELKKNTNLLKKYPKTMGEDYLIKSQIDFIKRRFDISLKNSQLLPSFGTREVLFNFPQFLLFDKKNPKIAFTNPFYQIYEGASIASRAKILHLPLLKENKFKPIIDEASLKDCDLVILNSPSNPTGSVLSLSELQDWAALAIKYDFILLNDECYSEIYYENPPNSLLNAAIANKNFDFKNILVVNSISKRSSAPGLRSGFIAGDAKILENYLKYRTYLGCASPLPLQKAASVAWSDGLHAEKIRKKYAKNLKLASEILNISVPQGGFYIWLEVKNAQEFTKFLYKEKSVKVLPGCYLGRNDLGKNYVRIALVYEPEITKIALERISSFLKDNS